MIPKVTRITATVCPSCKAKAVSSSIDHQHCNGEWNEYVTYECGLKLHWSPNFSCEQTAALCKGDKKEVTLVIQVALDLCMPKSFDPKSIVLEVPTYGWGIERSKHIELLRVKGIAKA